MGVKKHIELLAKSSSSDTPYTVKCYLEENKMSFFCSCRAGDNRMLCKHVRKIMAGDDSILYDKNQKKELEAIRNHLTKTEIPLLLSELDRYDSILEEAKKNTDKLKKKLKVLLLSHIEQ
jgi:hypothetical protein